MSKRTDVHKPSVVNPDDYDYVGFCAQADAHNFEFVAMERKRVEARRTELGAMYSSHAHGGTCHVCGAWANTMVVWHHVPSNTFVKTGETCAEKMDFAHSTEFNRFRANLKDAMMHKAGKAKAELLLKGYGLEAAWEFYNSDESYVVKGNVTEEHTVRDIVRNLVKYGSLSEAQQKYVGNLLERVAKRPEVEAARAAAKALLNPVPAEVATKRSTLTGEVLSTKMQDGYYGFEHKMLFLDDRGFKVWGSVPAVLGNVQRGDRVQFDAKVTVSNDDKTFGFFSRPTKAVTLKAEEEVA